MKIPVCQVLVAMAITSKVDRKEVETILDPGEAKD